MPKFTCKNIKPGSFVTYFEFVEEMFFEGEKELYPVRTDDPSKWKDWFQSFPEEYVYHKSWLNKVSEEGE